MSRKKTVKIIYDAIKDPIKKLFRSNVVFCEAMGFTGRDSWVSDLKRGRNLPSPEEAARMCVLLQTTPEEILSEEADIELVRGLLEQERENGAEKERPADGEAPDQDRLIEIIKGNRDKAFLLKVLNELNKSLQDLE